MKSWLQKKWNNGKMLAELTPAFFLSLTFCFMIFIYAPLELYINNVDEFWYDVYLLFPFIIKDFFLFLIDVFNRSKNPGIITGTAREILQRPHIFRKTRASKPASCP